MQTVAAENDWKKSPYYSLFYNGEVSEAASRFAKNIPSLLRLSDGSRLLDAACGQGFPAVSLAGPALDITGIDADASDIAKARLYEKEQLQFAQHDLRLPYLSNYFDAVIILFDRFGFYRTKREGSSALRTMATSLRASGRLILDYRNTAIPAAAHPIRVEPGNNKTFTFQETENEDFYTTKITVDDPALENPVHYTTQQIRLTLEDLTSLLSAQNLSVETIYGDYDLSPYEPATSPRLIIVASKQTQEATDKMKRLYSDGRTTDALT